jgi:sigma-B regulation protein RsbU (phosphoserine phosphatase)
MVASEKGTAPVIAVVISDLFDQYQRMILEGIRYQAASTHAVLACFDAGMVDIRDESCLSENQIFALISNSTVDAVIIMSGAIISQSVEELKYIYSRCEGIPKISIGIPIEGMHSLLIDNSAGMSELCEHFITVHGSKRIAFIRGPQNNEEAEIRFGAFCDALERHWIPFDPELTYLGDFDFYAGERAVHHWCIERKVRFDTLISADDQSAIFAMEALKKLNFAIHPISMSAALTISTNPITPRRP